MKQDKRIKKSKTAMKSALFQLMHKKAYAQITICELCETADVNRSTFYSNYEQLDDCLKEIHYDFFDAMIANANLNLEHQHFLHRKTAVITGMLNYIQHHEAEVKVLFNNDENNVLVKNMLLFFTQRFGVKQFDHPDNYPLIYHTSAFFTLVNQWVRSHFPISAESLSEMILKQSEPYYQTHEFIGQLQKNHV